MRPHRVARGAGARTSDAATPRSTARTIRIVSPSAPTVSAHRHRPREAPRARHRNEAQGEEPAPDAQPEPEPASRARTPPGRAATRCRRRGARRARTWDPPPGRCRSAHGTRERRSRLPRRGARSRDRRRGPPRAAGARRPGAARPPPPPSAPTRTRTTPRRGRPSNASFRAPRGRSPAHRRLARRPRRRAARSGLRSVRGPSSTSPRPRAAGALRPRTRGGPAARRSGRALISRKTCAPAERSGVAAAAVQPPEMTGKEIERPLPGGSGTRTRRSCRGGRS